MSREDLKGGFTFLIDAAALYKIEDLPVDGYGSWTAGGSRCSSRSRYYVQIANGDLMRVDSTIKHNREPAHWDLKLTQTRYVHPAADRRFTKITYHVKDREGGIKRWAAVTYTWLCQPFHFKPLPHGNCKGGKKELKPFQRTYPSVLAAMKSQLPMKMPKDVLEDIQGGFGIPPGNTEPQTPLPAIPRNRKQLYNLNREAAKDTGGTLDHRKWRKTGPAAGRPPGEMDEYGLEDGVPYEDIHYVIEPSELPGIPAEDLNHLKEAADALLSEDWRFKDDADDPNVCLILDGERELRLEDFRCPCEEFAGLRHLCRHTYALAVRRDRLDEHLNSVHIAAVSSLGEVEGVELVLPDGTADAVLVDAGAVGDDQTYQLVPDHQVLMGREEIVVAGVGEEMPSDIMMAN